MNNGSKKKKTLKNPLSQRNARRIHWTPENPAEKLTEDQVNVKHPTFLKWRTYVVKMLLHIKAIY
jgi:hypothetical protein